MDYKIKTAIIGNGYWSKILQHYVKEYFNIKYVCDSKTDLSAIWKDKEITNVFVVTPIETHYNIVREALTQNKHVFVEKPLTTNYDEAYNIYKLAKEFDKKVVVDYTYTFSELLKSLDKPDYVYIDLYRINPVKYKDWNVHWILTPHVVSILNMFFDLSDLKLHNYNLHNGTIESKNCRCSVSLDTVNHTHIEFVNKNDKFIYTPSKNGLRNAVKYFYDVVINNKEHNLVSAMNITRVIERCLEYNLQNQI